jgi:phosphatidate cytidylyltransferase
VTDDRTSGPPDRSDDPDGLTDVFTGEPGDVQFDVGTEGEADFAAPPPDDAASQTGPDESRFTAAPQMGETLPPELAPPEGGELFEPFELADPTDPGFTLSDLAGDADDGNGEPPPAPVVELPLAPPPPEVPPGEVLEFPTGAPADDVPPVDRAVDWEDFTDNDYVGSSTQEYEGLAAELERSRYEETEQSAVAAAMPGLETGVVGLDDVTGEVPAEASAEPASLTDLGLRIATGLGLLLLFSLSLLTPIALGVLAVIVFTFAAFEFYAALLRTGHHPVSAFGLAGTLGCLLGALIWGVVAIPVAIVATLIAVALFYGTTAPREHTLRDASLTILGLAWVGGFGAFAMPIIASDDYVWLIGGAVVLVVAMDVGQYFSGRTFGRRPLAPVISPKKTVEGLVGGALITLVIGFGLRFLGPVSRMGALLLAGAAVGMGPLGDLAVSSIKRQIGVKDMGTLLPGYGGILDRIDALLFVVPAAWVVYSATGLIT